MSVQTPQPPQPPHSAPPTGPGGGYGGNFQPQQQKPQRNTIGLIALIVAVVGFIFACIPGALIMGWILLPIAFVLSIVSFFQTGKRKGMGIAALILSIVGTLVGVIVFFAVVADAFDDAFNEEVTASTPDDEEGEGAEADAGEDADDSEGDAHESAEPAAEEGTRDNPYPIGTTLESDDWELTINEVELDATEEVMAENEFNEEPSEDSQYVLVNLTATYVGDDGNGDMPWVMVSYVTPGGNTINSYDANAVAPDGFDDSETLYEGASTSGNVVIEAPSEDVEDGTLAVEVSAFSDKQFVAVK